MTAPPAADGGRRRRTVWGPPPWLWLIVVLLAAQAPTGLFATHRRAAAVVREWQEVGGGGRLTVGVLTLVQSLPLAVALAAALVLLSPRVRMRLVERWNGLMAPDDPRVAPDTAVVYAEMQRFLTARAPGTVLRVSNQVQQLARVYPGGRRTARVGVFVPMVTLWDEDRDAARAALLHELGHLRAGEQHVCGLGSPFVALVVLWPYLLLAFGVLPVALLFLDGNPTAPLMGAQAVLVLLAVPKLLLVVVGALWSAELAADRYAGRAAGRETLRRGFDRVERGAPGGLARLYHPPIRLRRWFAAEPDRWARQLLLVLWWPAAVLVEALLDLLGGALALRLLGGEWDGWDAAWGAALRLAHDQLAGGPLWWGVLVALVGWPLVARRWPRGWGWHGGERGGLPRGAYATGALLPVVLLCLGLLPGPTGPGTVSDGPAPSATPSAGPGDLPSPCPSRSAPAPPSPPTDLPSFEDPPPSGAAPVAPGRERAFRTVRVRTVTPLSGTPPGTARDLADRLGRARWRLTADGTLTADLDAVPALRTTSVGGATRLLYGERTGTTEVSATTTWVWARLHTPGGRPPELHLVRAATLATRAVVACRASASTTTSAARLVLELGAP
ncbi:hypothetical protein [Streptomyces sp. NPDC002490]|uniref:hypothetical protein n=1 Tax=Streptomyces sp. NPDC002490 TaxID=3154416 RepID=UPI003334A337